MSSNEICIIFNAIHKFELAPINWEKTGYSGRDRIEVYLPEFHQINSVALQRGKICIWASVNTKPTMRVRHYFWVVGTGVPFDHCEATHKFLGMVQQGQFVWHVFQETLT